LKHDEVTEGDENMSRHSHAHSALQALVSAELTRNAFLLDDSVKTKTPFEADNLKHLSAELAHFAFSAGVHARLALGKEMEAWAVVGVLESKVIEQRKIGARIGAQMNALNAETKRNQLMEAMYQLIKKHNNISLAAQLLSKQNVLGKKA